MNGVCYNGEWVLPLSSDYAVCQLDLSDVYIGQNQAITNSMFYTRNGFDESIYDYKKDKLIHPNDIKEGSQVIALLGNNIILLSDGFLYQYNTQTEELTTIGNANLFYEANRLTSGLEYKDNRSNTIYAFDDDGNYIDFNCSDYDIYKVNAITGENIIFSAKNSNDDYYTLAIDKNGNRIIEPIKGTAGTAYIYKDYIILLNVHTDVGTTHYIINRVTGEVKNTDNYIQAFDSESGKLLIQTSQGNYYIADVSDPETLLNPFELADE